VAWPRTVNFAKYAILREIAYFFVWGGATKHPHHTKHLSEKYLSAKNNCRRDLIKNEVGGYMKGAGWTAK
jgi:hypothetical protein